MEANQESPNSKDKISSEYYQEWRENPITRKLFEILNEQVEVRKEAMSRGTPVMSAQQVGEWYIRVCTQAEVYASIQNITLEDFNDYEGKV